MKLFLSYSHKDEKHLNAFLKHIHLAKTSGFVADIFHDEKNNGGKRISENVKQKLEDADVVVLFISPNWIDSEFCMEEYIMALDFDKEIFLIILDHCDWKSMFPGIKASPKDGKPLVIWENENEAWLDVIKILKQSLSGIVLDKKEFTDKFEKFINNPGDFMSSARQDVLKLKDFYVPLPLKKRIFDSRTENKGTMSAEFLENVKKISNNRIFILGDEQSGKTALCQILCEKYKSTKMFPVYIDGKNVSNDNLKQIERSAFERQYKNIKNDNVKDGEKIVIFDDFAYEEKIKKQQDIRSLIHKICEKNYHAFILITSSIAKFTPLSWERFFLENDFSVYDIERIGYRRRAKIIEKWINATHSGEDVEKIRNLVDQQRELVDAMFMENALPVTPFYILMTLNLMSSDLSLSGYKGDTITSYGHCYYVIITHQFHKSGIEPKDFGGCHNFLTELAFYMYEKDISEINDNHMKIFQRKYEKIYMGVPPRLTDRLFKSTIFTNNRRMEEYVFYYYVAKRMSGDMNAGDDRQEHVKQDIDRILSEAHKKRYGHILLFLVHHMPKNKYLQNKLNEEMNSLFKDEKESTLDDEETRHLDEFLAKISPPKIKENISEEEIKVARDDKIKRTEEEGKSDAQLSDKAEQDEDETFINFSKSFRMIKIAGSLLKNEYRTMEKQDLKRLSLSTRGVTFRIISLFIRSIKDYPNELKAYLSTVLSLKNREWKDLPEHEKEEHLKEIIGKLSVGFSLMMINRCAWSIGSEELAELIGKISETEKQPSSKLLHLTTKLWYKKDLNTSEIEELHEKWEKNHLLADVLLRSVLYHHLEMHSEKRKKREQVAAIFETGPRTAALIQHKRIKK